MDRLFFVDVIFYVLRLIGGDILKRYIKNVDDYFLIFLIMYLYGLIV